jgi:hypothetical protein
MIQTDLLNDPEIDIVVELIGGMTTAKSFISTALKTASML